MASSSSCDAIQLEGSDGSQMVKLVQLLETLIKKIDRILALNPAAPVLESDLQQTLHVVGARMQEYEDEQKKLTEEYQRYISSVEATLAGFKTSLSPDMAVLTTLCTGVALLFSFSSADSLLLWDEAWETRSKRRAALNP